jgi:xanthine dehydrogenase accessory factor
MIGSRAKRVQLFANLREAGVDDAFLALVRTPMGLPIGARTHEEIAVAVVAEIVQVRRLGSAPAANFGYGAGPDGRRDDDCAPR